MYMNSQVIIDVIANRPLPLKKVELHLFLASAARRPLVQDMTTAA